MGIVHVPNPGDVLMCDFDGFKPPEMVKKRKVIVLSRRSRERMPETYIVIPVSKSCPTPPEGCHVEFKARSYDFFDLAESVWAKCDMVTCVAYHRLDRLKLHGRYTKTSLRKDDLEAVRKAVLHSIGMEEWSQPADVVEVK